MPDFSQFCAEFSEKVFSDIRDLSAGSEGILRIGYSKTETKVWKWVEDSEFCI